VIEEFSMPVKKKDIPEEKKLLIRPKARHLIYVALGKDFLDYDNCIVNDCLWALLISSNRQALCLTTAECFIEKPFVSIYG